MCVAIYCYENRWYLCQQLIWFFSRQIKGDTLIKSSNENGIFHIKAVQGLGNLKNNSWVTRYAYSIRPVPFLPWYEQEKS